MIAIFGNSMSSVEMKKETCVEDHELQDSKDEISFVEDSILYSPEDASVSMVSEHSALPALSLKQEDSLPVSYSFIMLIHIYL